MHAGYVGVEHFRDLASLILVHKLATMTKAIVPLLSCQQYTTAILMLPLEPFLLPLGTHEARTHHYP